MVVYKRFDCIQLTSFLKLFFFLFCLAGLASEDVLKSPSLKERNQQANTSTKCSSEKRPQPLAEEPVIKPSQAQTKNTNSDNVVTQTNESGTTPSLLRRKRVLPNLGLASRRRHSSVSKENVEKNPEVPEVRHEEIVTTTRQDLVGHTSVSIVKSSVLF